MHSRVVGFDFFQFNSIWSEGVEKKYKRKLPSHWEFFDRFVGDVLITSSSSRFCSNCIFGVFSHQFRLFSYGWKWWCWCTRLRPTKQPVCFRDAVYPNISGRSGMRPLQQILTYPVRPVRYKIPIRTPLIKTRSSRYHEAQSVCWGLPSLFAGRCGLHGRSPIIFGVPQL